MRLIARETFVFSYRVIADKAVYKIVFTIVSLMFGFVRHIIHLKLSRKVDTAFEVDPISRLSSHKYIVRVLQ